MINTTCLTALTRSIEEATQTDPAIDRWLDRAKELQRELSLRVLSLSRYIKELPESSYASYADTLASVLQDPEFDPNLDDIRDLKNNIQTLAGRLEQLGYPDKASAIITALDKPMRQNK